MWVEEDLLKFMSEENTNDKLIMLVKLLRRNSKNSLETIKNAWNLKRRKKAKLFCFAEKCKELKKVTLNPE